MAKGEKDSGFKIASEGPSGVGKVVLVGTYKKGQIERCSKWYNYPISIKGKIDEASAKRVTELWLFRGKEDGRYFAVEFEGVKTRAELVNSYGYKAAGRSHGDVYLLYKILAKVRDPATGFAEAVIVRTSDFARTPRVRAQIKAYLESPERKDEKTAGRLPSIVTSLAPRQLRVWDAVQVDFFDELFAGNRSCDGECHERSNGRSLHVGTLFSGIGAFEQSLKKLGIPHEIEFACDNGEIELIPLEKCERIKYKDFERREKKLSADEAKEFSKLKAEVTERLAQISRRVRAARDLRMKQFVVQDVYSTYAPGEKNLVKETYMANYQLPESRFYLDVRFFDGRDFRRRIDIIVGGSPCQSFSSNGKRKGIEDTRGTLFYDYARIISETCPRCFIFENVKGLVLHDGGRTWEIVKNTFKSLNYDIYLNKNIDGLESATLNARDYGIPQNRERIFLVGIRKDIKLRSPFVFPGKKKLVKYVPEFLDDEVPGKYYLAKKGFEFVTTHPTRAQVGQLVMNCQKANQQFNWNGDFIFEPLSSFRNGGPPKKAYVGEYKGQRGVCRMFTPRECLRLMGFPDDFVMASKDAVMYRQCGNSIVVNVLESIMMQLQKAGVFDD